MAPSRLSKVLQGVTVTSLASLGGFFVWTKHARFTPDNQFGPTAEPLFQSKWFLKFNPNANPSTHDECVRRIPLHKLRPELVEDARHGGSKLVEAFNQGVWGGFGYTIQRLYLERKYRNDTTTAHQLWTPEQLQTSTYDVGTEITDHFVVLDKTPTSVLIRCGDSPLHNPDTSRPSDGLFELDAKADFDKGVAEFRLKSIFYQGEGEAQDKTHGPMPDTIQWLHKLYTKLWMESAMRRVTQ
ncbi:hypothetical protein A1O3_00297 [Capronia epimyces CBS 606.96]|uniref:Uncharacterized protein n=1 Tax=Capronia epimyces CBS 606.96 TaxID=1182542 RepID=W9YFS8_9EURO|nr:uncharacterized protein A1O3_00297 [Capronia epimyces CBS 606.96]EXJ91747.1 hypothetical protein A1O3_00297 [Capronia epimyces CBS 606.96]